MADRKLFAPEGPELNQGRDLTRSNRVKLGQYLSDRTSGKPSPSDDASFEPNDYQYTPRSNDFPVSRSPDELELSKDGNRNYVLPQVPSDQATFTDDRNDVERWGKSDFNGEVGWKSTTQAERAGDEQNKRRVLYKMRGDTGIENESNQYSEVLRKGISSVLATNAFTQDGSFALKESQPNSSWQKKDPNETLKSMREAALDVLGYSAGLIKPDGSERSQLGRIGQMLNIDNQSVKKGVDGFRYKKDNSPLEVTGGSSTVGPSEDQPFDGIPLQLVGASNINVVPDDGLGTTGGIYSGFSYGNKNDFNTPFGSLARGAETILFALAAAAAIFVAISIWSAVLSLIFYKLDRPEYRTGVNPPGHERDTSVASDLLALLFGTKRPYNVNTLVAGFEGVISFLGVDIGPTGAASAVAGAVINFAFSPDYYVLICRMVLNGVYSFVGQSSVGGGAAGAITALANLRTNKLVSFVNRMIDIGSISLRGVDTTTDIEPGGKDESYYGQAVNRVARSRQFGNKLAWRNTATAMSILSPDVIRDGSASLYKTSPNFANIWADRIAKRVAGFKVATGNESANLIERELNSEYVPFYFRDLRTDEVISFHAFLEDLSDSFTANYTAVEGFGRQDPVQIYKGTNRSIGFSFHVVSTSPKDHDVMWYKINKLVSLLYPQYTDGIKVEDTVGNKFEVPFSQVYGASPLVRLRIGDVISSNYSRFGLSRLFGLGKANTNFSEGSPDIFQKSVDQYNETLPVSAGGKGGSKTSKDAEDLIDFGPGNSSQEKNTFNPLSIIKTSVKARVIRGGIYRGTSDKLGAFSRTYAVHIRPGTICSVLPPDAEVFTNNYLLNNDVGNKSVCLVKLDDAVTVNPRDLGNDPIKLEYVYIPYELIEYIEEKLTIPAIPVGIGSNQEDINITRNFFVPANNSIVQSFESSMGMGLAGVITNMSMDWNEATWETDRIGGKAPIWLKITMQFAPIHDLPMGLDSTGVQIAPAYPVGDLTRRMHGIDVPRGTSDKGSDVLPGYEYSSNPNDYPTSGKSRSNSGGAGTTPVLNNTSEIPTTRYTKRLI